MRLDKVEAHRLLQHAAERNGGAWINHSRLVALAVEEIAGYCGMDKEKAYALGLLHDIGKCFGLSKIRHGLLGYDLLCSFSQDEAAGICLSHCFAIKDIQVYQGLEDYLPDEKKRVEKFLKNYEYTDYDRLIILADGLAQNDNYCSLETRISDILSRNEGFSELFIQNLEKKKELLRYFSEKAGRDVSTLNCMSRAYAG